MHSFSITAIGNLAANPTLSSRAGGSIARLCLLGDDYAGRDEQGASRESLTALWFVAFGVVAETIAGTARVGDQLILHAQVRANNWTDAEGERQYDHTFVVQSFRFGAPGKATRAYFAERDSQGHGAVPADA